MKTVLALSRIIVGVLFIFSGLIKANDPLGLSYKMQEFFEIWGWHGFNTYTLALSVLMIAFEIIAGVAVLLGWKMRLFSWLLLLLTVFFTFLTGYALFSGKVRECGCFGDCIPLTAQQSFLKDLVLLLLILVIFANRKNIKSYLAPGLSAALLLTAAIGSFALQWYVLLYLPVVDCLPYKKGRNISQQMKIPPGSIPDSTVISFVYEKAGKQVEFTADKFPADFDDSLYTFIKRYDKLVRKGNAEPAIKDFALTTESGNDTTQAILDIPGYTILVFTRGLDDDTPVWAAGLKKTYDLARSNQIPVFFVTNDYAQVGSWLSNRNMSEYAKVLKCDFVAIKTAARADPTIYVLRKGTIMGKWSHADLEKAFNYLKKWNDSPY